MQTIISSTVLPPKWLHPNLKFLWDYAVMRTQESAEDSGKEVESLTYGDYVIVLKAAAQKYAKIFDLSTFNTEMKMKRKKESVMSFLYYSMKDPLTKKTVGLLTKIASFVSVLTENSVGSRFEKMLSAVQEQLEYSSLFKGIQTVFPQTRILGPSNPDQMVGELKSVMNDFIQTPNVDLWPTDYPGYESVIFATEALKKLFSAFLAKY